MEAKRIIAFDYEKEGRLYQLQMPDGAPLGEAYEATATFLSEMARLIKEHSDSAMPKEMEDAEAAEVMEAMEIVEDPKE